MESDIHFESRKRQHIQLALANENQATGFSELDRVRLIHEALPDFDFSDINIRQRIFRRETKQNLVVNSPIFISSMTAGFEGSLQLNAVLAEAAQNCNWLMGVGSQRKELNKELKLSDFGAESEWVKLRAKAPKALLAGNIGISQLITHGDRIQGLVDSLGAVALFVHTNPLQEALQPEGTPQFKGSLQAIEKLCSRLSVPVILKEVGCGFSKATLRRLANTGLAAIDLSGLGGTHWGRLEGMRCPEDSLQKKASQVFANWGNSTVQSLLWAKEVKQEIKEELKQETKKDMDFEVWASGGVRSGLDAAKLLAMGANMVGVAKPLLEAALQGPEKVVEVMKQMEFELKVAMFCTGVPNLDVFARYFATNDNDKEKVWCYEKRS